VISNEHHVPIKIVGNVRKRKQAIPAWAGLGRLGEKSDQPCAGQHPICTQQRQIRPYAEHTRVGAALRSLKRCRPACWRAAGLPANN